jgi:hypothetical protein
MTGGGGAASVVVVADADGVALVVVGFVVGNDGAGPSVLVEVGSVLARGFVLAVPLVPAVGVVLAETTGTGTATPFGRIEMPGAGVLEVGTAPSREVPSVRCSTGWDGAPGVPDT